MVETTDAPPVNGGVEIQTAHVEVVQKQPATGMEVLVETALTLLTTETPLGVERVGGVETTDARCAAGSNESESSVDSRVEIPPAHVEEGQKQPATGMEVPVETPMALVDVHQ